MFAKFILELYNFYYKSRNIKRSDTWYYWRVYVTTDIQVL